MLYVPIDETMKTLSLEKTQGAGQEANARHGPIIER
jgi:hypothetical protein